MTIVGVVGNVLTERLDADARPMLYRPMAQATNLSFALVVRSAGDPSRLSSELSRVVRAADPDLPTFAVRTMAQVQAAATSTRRFSMQVIAAFAMLALLLAAIGIYGVMAYLVSQRTHEIGIRMALGARPFSVLRMVVSYALALAAGGVAIGVVGALLMSRLLAGVLFRVSATDPATFIIIGTTLIATAALAASTPARRAARVDPMIALRGE
jgi:putative ABC transport system permease protein